jgi:hypothetical protein
MADIVKQLKVLLEEAQQLRANEQWTFEDYERISTEAIQLVIKDGNGRFLEPFIKLAPRDWRERAAQNRKTRAA